ncbi:hypothetical protein EZS27_006046, partial [termite gut metagenome]
SSLGFYFRRIQAKSGYIPAIIATANKIARIIYTMVKSKTEFDVRAAERKRGFITSEFYLSRYITKHFTAGIGKTKRIKSWILFNPYWQLS